MSNQSYVQKGKLTLLSLFAMAIGGLISCSSPVDNIVRGVPVAPPGNQNFKIVPLRTSGALVTDYTLVVSGERDTTITKTGLTAEDTVVLSNVTSGNYTVEISQTGFLGRIKSTDLIVPTDESADFEAIMEIRLTKVNEPVAVSQAASSFVVPDEGGEPDDVPTTVDIPAGAVPPGVTAITITPIEADPEAPETDANGTVVVSYDMQPSGTVFETPIVLTIPLNVPAAFVAAGVQYFFEYTHTGTIPGFANGELQRIEIEVSADGKSGRVEVPHFSTWKARSGIEITETNRQQSRNFLSECAGGINEVYTLTGRLGGSYLAVTGLVGTGVTSAGQAVRDVSFSVDVQIDGAPFFVQRATGTQTVFDYVITTRNGNVIERGTGIPRKAGFATFESVTECHDSGG
ncbi:MAG: hypothetical protein RIC03_02205 [Cyclobacteriaceae bacterium]